MPPILPQRLRLVLITDRCVSRLPLLATIEAALRGGVTAVILREKDLSTRELYEIALPLRHITRAANALLILNDRIDIALAVGADGVHLGWQSLPLSQARLLLGKERVIGISTHSVDEALNAQKAGAGYITFSPIFPTPSKTGLVAVQGIDGLLRARKVIDIPLVGLGGIDSGNFKEVLAAGADGIAVIRAILASEDPESAARNLAKSPSELLDLSLFH